jgi:hypothetical protein
MVEVSLSSSHPCTSSPGPPNLAISVHRQPFYVSQSFRTSDRLVLLVDSNPVLS